MFQRDRMNWAGGFVWGRKGGGGGGGGGFSLIWAIQVCAAAKGMDFFGRFGQK